MQKTSFKSGGRLLVYTQKKGKNMYFFKVLICTILRKIKYKDATVTALCFFVLKCTSRMYPC